MLSSLLLASTLVFAAQSGSLVVLVKSDGSVPASWSDDLQAAAKDAAGQTSMKWVPPPQVSLSDAQLALGCGSWDSACAGQIAGMMNADSALVVELEKKGKGAWVSTQMISNTGKPAGKRQRFELPDRAAAGLAVARAVTVSAVTGSPPTILSATTDVAGAEVFIDGEKKGKTPLTLAGELSPGAHQVQFRMEGRAPVTQNVNIESGRVTKVGAVMVAAAPTEPDTPSIGEPAETPPDLEPSPEVTPAAEQTAEPFHLDPIIGYSVIGVGAAVALVGAGLYGAHVAVKLSADPRPCTDPQQLNNPARTCETQAEAYARLERDRETIDNTMFGLYVGFITAEVVAAVLVAAGAGLAVFSLVTAEE